MSGSVLFLPGNGVQKSETFTSSGTWTRPLGVEVVIVEAIGGGGGGGGGLGNTAGNSRGGQGGGGGVHSSRVVNVSGNVSVTLGTAGSAGTGGVGSSTPGGNGGNTSFGSTIFFGGDGGVDGTSIGTSGLITTYYFSNGARGGKGNIDVAGTLTDQVNHDGEALFAAGGIKGSGLAAGGGGGAGVGVGANGGATAVVGSAAGANSGAGGGGGGNTANGGNGGTGWMRVTWIEIAE